MAVRLLEDGWRVAAVARSDETLTVVAERGVLALKADAAKPRTLSAALEIAATVAPLAEPRSHRSLPEVHLR